MASYLCVKMNSSATKSYNIKSSANKPYLRVDTGFIPLTTATATGPKVMVRAGGVNYRLADFITTTTAITTGTSYLTSAKTTGTSYVTGSRSSTSDTGYATRASTSSTGYQTRWSTYATGYETRSSTSATGYVTRASTSATGYKSRASTSATGYQVRTGSWDHQNMSSRTFKGNSSYYINNIISFSNPLSTTSTKGIGRISFTFRNSKLKASIVASNSTTTIPTLINYTGYFGLNFSGYTYMRSYSLTMMVIVDKSTLYSKSYNNLYNVTGVGLILDYSDAIKDYLIETNYTYVSTAANWRNEISYVRETAISGPNYINTITMGVTRNPSNYSYITFFGYNGTNSYDDINSTTKSYSNYKYTNTTATTYATRSSTSTTTYGTRASTYNTTYATRASTSKTTFAARASTSNTTYATRSSTSATTYATRSSQYTSNTSYLTQSETYQTSYITTSSETTMEG